jgi:uncharacterized repeat protein (TIGR02543 family)
MKRFYAAFILFAFCFAAHSVSAAPYAYITQATGGTVTVYDTVKNKKVTTINVGGIDRAPLAIAMSPDGRKAYVPSAAWDDALTSIVYVIDVLTHSVTHSITVGTHPAGAAILPNGTKLYVAGYTGPVSSGGLPGISIINTDTYTIESTIPLGPHPYAVAAHPDGSKVYVTDIENQTVTVIDTASITITQTTNVGNWPGGIAVHPGGMTVWVANRDSQTISVIDTSNNNITDTINLPGNPFCVAFSPDGTRAYVTSVGNSVWVIDTVLRTVMATIDVGPSQGGGVDVSPDGAYVYVVTSYPDFEKKKMVNEGVKVIDAVSNTVTKKIKSSGVPVSLGKFIGGPQFHMTANISGSGTGKVISKKLPDIDCGGKCEADFYVNRKVQLQAIPDEGSVFTGWSGDCAKKSKTCTLVVTDDYSVTATFEPK